MSPRLRFFDSAEFAIALFSFLLHFVWEMWQIPLYEGMLEISHWEGVAFCTRAAAGDVLIALVAFWGAAAVSSDRLWLLSPDPIHWCTFLTTGVVITATVEFLSIDILGRWAYAETMPTVPIIGTGLSPVLQWLVLPPIVLWLSKRHLSASRAAHL